MKMIVAVLFVGLLQAAGIVMTALPLIGFRQRLFNLRLLGLYSSSRFTIALPMASPTFM